MRTNDPYFLTEEARFDAVHGNGAYSRLLEFLRTPVLSYDQIGQKFSITKQRVSQIAKNCGINGRLRQRLYTNLRPPCVVNKHADYPAGVRRVLDELQRRKVGFLPCYVASTRNDRILFKSLRVVMVRGTLCRIVYLDATKRPRYVLLRVPHDDGKARALICGFKARGKFRLYVIPVVELIRVRCVNLPVSGVYANYPHLIRDWTVFEDAWHLLV